MPYPTNVPARFWAKVDKTETCWLWTKALNNKGYGVFSIGSGPGRLQLAHRVSWRLAGLPLDDTVVLDHDCHTPACVNPAHLIPGTQKQNRENLAGANVNSKSGIRGVSWNTSKRRWIVQVYHNYKRVYSASFTDLALAEAAAIAKRTEVFSRNNADR